MYDKCLWVSSSVKGKLLPTPPRGIEWPTKSMAKVGGNPSIRIIPLPSANSLLRG